MKKLLCLLIATLVAMSTLVFVGCESNAIEPIDDLKGKVNGIMAEIAADGTLDSIIDSYFNGNSTFTYENKSSSPKKGDFVVATNAYFPPFEYFKGNKFVGIDIEIAKLIADELGMNLFVKDMDFDAIIESVKLGDCHIGMAGLTVNEDRLTQVDFSDGYYTSAQVLTVAASNNEFDGKSANEIMEILSAKSSSYKVGAQNGTTGYMFSAGDEGFGYDGFKNLSTKGYTTGALAIEDLAIGNIDAVVLDKQPSLMIAANNNKVKVIDVELTAETYAFAIKKA